MRYFVIFSLVFLASCSPAAASAVPPEPETLVHESESTQAIPTVLPANDMSTSPLPDGPLTIVALGDSLTQGDGDDSGRGSPVRLLDLVNATRPNSTITNLGQSGWNSDALIAGDQGIESQL